MMVTYMECTDCKYCANFDDGYRLFCLHHELLSSEVEKYLSVGERDALDCEKFDAEGNATIFTYEQLKEALEYGRIRYGDFFLYKGVREWCEQFIKQEETKG